MVQLTLTLAKTGFGNTTLGSNLMVETQTVFVVDPALEAKLADGYKVTDVKVSEIPYAGYNRPSNTTASNY